MDCVGGGGGGSEPKRWQCRLMFLSFGSLLQLPTFRNLYQPTTSTDGFR
ncbi:hypothetical protein PspLS_08205 [Pyricularia sp. CBS 133598]|nr:hypothetical protein PspLS_08205 [Pyricularia sp. CBS 133598]